MGTDEFFMREAFRLALKGKGRVATNPLVGAVIVKKGKIIAKGWHTAYGADHAEVEAIKRAGKEVSGATLYVTLEPCSTYGKRPPCTDAIIKAGIKKVVFSDTDPNPLNRRKAKRILERSGISVKSGIMRGENLKINKPFYAVQKYKRPYIALKLAQSLDGKIAAFTGDSKWISSVNSRRFVHRLRGEFDAVMVGSNTAIADNPMLDVRLVKGKNPVRVVLDRKSKLPLDLKVFRDGNVIACLGKGSDWKRYENAAIPFIVSRYAGKSEFLLDILSKLPDFKIASLLVEGGGELAYSSVSAGVVDKLYLFISPLIIGGRRAYPSFGGRGEAKIEDGFRLKHFEVKSIGKDILIEGEF